MSSKTLISNLALGHIAASKEIGNLETDKSKEAQVCRRFYAPMISEVFRDFDWPFARKYADLGLIEADPNEEWDFSYRYPSDCSRAIKILSGTRNDTRQSRVPYARGGDSVGSIIYTDKEDAQLKYILNNVSENSFTSDFVMMASFLLAGYIAPSVTDGDPFKLGERALNIYIVSKNKAESTSYNEQQADEDPESEFIRSRG